MSQADNNQVVFEGEDGNAGYASPALDLIATAFLLGLSVLVLVASWRLPVPGTWTTAPGLLPFLTAGSLAIMAVLLGISAIVRRRDGTPLWDETSRDRSEDARAIVLVVAVAVYVGALQGLAFQYYFDIGSIPMVLSAFEPVTIIALSAIIHIFWRGPLWITSLVSIGWTLTLSLVFQKVFSIPLPGGF
ncbi:Tripartite tricarboxylate transporter TctB family protein [Octadecabacter temperatus]|uniref:Tripartite tricarboxylate transporter TctB family protein n=1 Tax=Octadecabacter temperatus TaxID=1458307 RepID=A0A0K0Y3C3_9RHOB|nr:tripartite tricarboxylate transporter TctB family protein [Octadecabacter temperatus]AKS45367.1 Tripartite tricarboxylate transporter TctB family protein [Octadecabacter temperatus]SIN91412.1 Tripartite tricarboxylate transporter TctB family protein [Octadecabacter temperatus]